MDTLRIQLDGDDGVEKVAHVSNDGFELLIGYPDQWSIGLNRAQARQLAWGVLRWNAGEWFGLRRRAWYWLLRRRVNRNQRGQR